MVCGLPSSSGEMKRGARVVACCTKKYELRGSWKTDSLVHGIMMALSAVVSERILSGTNVSATGWELFHSSSW